SVTQTSARRIAGGVSRGDDPARVGGAVLQGDRRHRRPAARHGDVASGPRPPAAATSSDRTHAQGGVFMICHETRDLIHAYLDGELDLVRSLEIERHLPACQACALTLRNHQALRSGITTSSLYHQAPADLRRRVQSAARQTNQAETKSRLLSWRRLSVGASL